MPMLHDQLNTLANIKQKIKKSANKFMKISPDLNQTIIKSQTHEIKTSVIPYDQMHILDSTIHLCNFKIKCTLTTITESKEDFFFLQKAQRHRVVWNITQSIIG